MLLRGKKFDIANGEHLKREYEGIPTGMEPMNETPASQEHANRYNETTTFTD